MQPSNPDQHGIAWLIYALMTVGAWGLYGVFLHTGRMNMKDPQSGLFKAFLFVGIAYFLTAVLAPIVVLWLQGATWTFPAKGLTWSLLAGIVGAVGAFCVLLAFGAGGMPSVVMSIIFAGAPIVNAAVALSIHPPAGGLLGLRWQFIVGILLAALGGCLVTLYKPPPAKTQHSSAPIEAPSQEPSNP
jgi:drug/metabolite transporter (DMT)-like permease